MKNGSCSAATVAGSAALPFVISTGEVMGLRPTQGDEKTGPVQQPPSMEAPPSPLSSRPELRRSVVERSAVSADLPWKCFSTGEVMGRWPAQGDEKRFSSNYRRRKRRPPLCHLDRSSEGA